MQRLSTGISRLLLITSNTYSIQSLPLASRSVFCCRQLSTKPRLSSDLTPTSTRSQEQVWEELKERKHKEFWSNGNKTYRWIYLLAAAAIINISVKYYRKKSAEPSHSVFAAPKFTPFTIIARETVSSTAFILTLRPSAYITEPRRNSSDPYETQWEQGIWSVEIKQPQLQIARSYTPLPPDENTKHGDLRFLIRKEKGGEVSNYLAGLAPRGTVELRGPHLGIELPDKVHEVLFLAGGTGIAPALQMIDTLLQRRTENIQAPKIHIVWSNRRREDCAGSVIQKKPVSMMPVVQELQALQQKYPDHLRVDYLVDEEGTILDQKKVASWTKNISEVKSMALTTRIDSKLLLVSGPEGFVNFVAGPKIWDNGKETQGEIGGLVGKLGLRDWKVWKL
jgi:cytochrome-b5 reductase